MLNLDFSNIRAFDGSKDNGFEELICQLAHLDKPENANYFVRKEGAGGDAGVECYWKLTDGTEHAWQAKYFLDRMEDSQWKQLSESVEAALDKHPSLTKYYVCLPRDWTDSRKVGKGGKKIKSAWDKWEEHVKQWRSWASERNMDVEFSYWCKHEISQMLQTDDPKFSGRALYWFNEPVIHPKLLKNIAIKSRDSLGERFTPENHLDLPIANVFDGLCLNKEWEGKLVHQRNLVRKLLKDLDMDFFSYSSFPKDERCWIDLYAELENIRDEYIRWAEQGAYYNQFKVIQDTYLRIEQLSELCSEKLFDYMYKETKTELQNKWRELNSMYSNIQMNLREMKDFLFGKATQATKSKAAVLLGEAGIGKSHLLCDISLKRLEKFLPTIFLLGQQYAGGNPLNFLLDQLDIRGISHSQILGALDAAGEAKRTRTLIVIDAINEGHYKDEWTNYISALLTEISNYPHISIIFSCRSTYANYILPELTEDRLTNVYHMGFKGYEHRAAMRYLANQGISKSSTPITSPEFSNPLFLKTCCKALKLNGYTSFPKGLHGQSKLFNFYLDSVEKIINRKKKYLPGQRIVQNALDDFVQLLYPDNLYGVAVSEAIKKINENDTNPQLGDNLTTLLIDEGLLSLDIVPDSNNKRGKEIIRFTYERFSDHSISQYIINHVNSENIEGEFIEEGSIGKLIKKGPGISGIIEALGIGFPEKFHREFIDYIPEDSIDYDWLFTSSFSDVLLWRAKESFTDRTIDLLNMIPDNRIYKESIDKLLALSTEPEHPWNADFLDKNLRRMKLANRDAFWSTHIAISDREEDGGQDESLVRTLIDWSLLVNLNNVETERIRLTAITLLWMTTTTNRKVRDQSTKSLARILSYSPELVPDLIRKYIGSDDPYLVERLFAAIYGAVCNIDNKKVLKEIAETVSEHVIEVENQYPHILMRDYARGILEFAHSKGVLSSGISPDIFRPPYKSEWPINNPSKDEIDKLAGDGFSSAIKSSVIGFMGDFGKYTMNCVHDWSPTQLSKEKPESSYDIHLKFAETLPDDLKRRYIALVNEKIEGNINVTFDFEEFLNSIKICEEIPEDEIEDEDEKEGDTWEILKEEINVILNENQKEYFRWVCGLGINDRQASFSRKWAQRWVCQRAYELGWQPDLFEEFERTHTKNYNRSVSRIERIGKKYQWIAFHELLARMADNLYWIDRGYSDVDDSEFWGPWQIDVRDLDPTLWLRETGDPERNELVNSWWQPYNFNFSSEDLQQQMSWLWNRDNIPSFNDLLEIVDPVDNQKWTVLRGFSSWNKTPEQDENTIPSQDAWFRINSCIVQRKDVDNLINDLMDKNLCDPDILRSISTGYQKFLKEYPWHPCYKELVEWIEPDSEEFWNKTINTKHLVPTCQYHWESGSTDKSLNNSISIYLPNKLLVEELGLSLKKDEFGTWVDSNNNPIFIDPSVKEKGPSYALIKSDVLNKWLEKNDLQLIWLIGGEKQLFTSMASKFYGRLVYSGTYFINDKELSGKMWFLEEPTDVDLE